MPTDLSPELALVFGGALPMLLEVIWTTQVQNAAASLVNPIFGRLLGRFLIAFIAFVC
jgi:hypothetical protein